MSRSTVFTLNRSQAVRLPKAVAFPDDVRDVEVIVVGKSRVITPVGQRWTDFFENGPFATDDFDVGPRDEPPQEREPF